MVVRVLTVKIDSNTQQALTKQLHRSKLRLEGLLENEGELTYAEKNVIDIVRILCGWPAEFSVLKDPCISAHSEEIDFGPE